MQRREKKRVLDARVQPAGPRLIATGSARAIGACAVKLDCKSAASVLHNDYMGLGGTHDLLCSGSHEGICPCCAPFRLGHSRPPFGTFGVLRDERVGAGTP